MSREWVSRADGHVGAGIGPSPSRSFERQWQSADHSRRPEEWLRHLLLWSAQSPWLGNSEDPTRGGWPSKIHYKTAGQISVPERWNTNAELQRSGGPRAGDQLEKRRRTAAHGPDCRDGRVPDDNQPEGGRLGDVRLCGDKYRGVPCGRFGSRASWWVDCGGSSGGLLGQMVYRVYKITQTRNLGPYSPNFSTNKNRKSGPVRIVTHVILHKSVFTNQNIRKFCS